MTIYREQSFSGHPNIENIITLIFARYPVIVRRKQTILLFYCTSLSKKHLVAHRNLLPLFRIVATLKDESFSGSQTAILRNLHILRAWLWIQKDGKRNKQIQRKSLFTERLYLNNPRLCFNFFFFAMALGAFNVKKYLLAGLVDSVNL